MWATIYEGCKWKLCTKCNIEKPAPDFCKQAITPKTRKDGLTSWCKLCYSQYFRRPRVQAARLFKEKQYLKRPRVKAQRSEIYRRYDAAPRNRYSDLVRTAQKRNLSMTLSFKEWSNLVEPNRCHYCEGDLGHSGTAMDRKINELGYTKENVVPCCGECNYMKRDMPYHEFILLANGLREIKRRRNERAVSA